MHWFRHENFPSGGEPAPPVPAQQLTPLSVLTSDFIEPRRAVVVVQANLKRGRSQLRPGLTQVKQLQPVRCHRLATRACGRKIRPSQAFAGKRTTIAAAQGPLHRQNRGLAP